MSWTLAEQLGQSSRVCGSDLKDRTCDCDLSGPLTYTREVPSLVTFEFSIAVNKIKNGIMLNILLFSSKYTVRIFTRNILLVMLDGDVVMKVMSYVVFRWIFGRGSSLKVLE